MTIQTKDQALRQAQRRGISRENLVLPNMTSSLADARPRGTIMSRNNHYFAMRLVFALAVLALMGTGVALAGQNCVCTRIGNQTFCNCY
jgi:hypothetical protein